MKTKGARVLVIDDDPFIQTVASALLDRLGCLGTVASDYETASAEIARAAATGAPIELVLIDLRLERTTGLEVCRRLRADGGAMALVCMSGDPGAVDRSALEDAGFDDVLAKPYSIHTLEACVARHAGGGT